MAAFDGLSERLIIKVLGVFRRKSPTAGGLYGIIPTCVE
jgi:hypothetical protein